MPPSSAGQVPVYAVPITDAHLAVLSGTPVPHPSDPQKTSLSLSTLAYQGTAFSLAEGLFFTAGHVVTEAAATGQIALGNLAAEKFELHSVTDYHVFPEVDLAVMRCPISAVTLPFSFEHLDMGQPVATAGWLLGPDPEYLTVLPRVFIGHVVTRRRMFRVGSRELPSQPAGYELSFGVPAGLSGAPLVTAEGKVAGIAVGTMTHAHDGVMRQLGVAIDLVELLRLESSGFGQIAKLLGQSPLPKRPPIPKVVQSPGGTLKYEHEMQAELAEGWPED